MLIFRSRPATTPERVVLTAFMSVSLRKELERDLAAFAVAIDRHVAVYALQASSQRFLDCVFLMAVNDRGCALAHALSMRTRGDVDHERIQTAARSRPAATH